MIRDGVIRSISPLSRKPPRVFAAPAFFDAHCHFLWMGMERIGIDLSGCDGAGSLLEAVAGRAGRQDEGIVRGEKWDESDWSDPRLPSLPELDSVTGDRPVMLRRVCGHSALVNTPMLRLVEALVPGTKTLGWPEGALLVEGPVLTAYELFPPTPGEMRLAVSLAQEAVFAAGVTGISTTESAGSIQTVADAAHPELSISVSVHSNDPLLWPDASRTGRFAVYGAKIFLDGGLGASTAAVEGSYADGSKASPAMDDAALGGLLEEAARRRLVPVVHAIGAEALRQLDRVSAQFSGRAPGTIRVEHAEQLEPAWPGGWRAGTHQFSMQPNFVRRWQQPGGMYDQRLGSAAARRLNPFSLLLRGGFKLGFGSDGMPFGPLWGLSGAVSHPEPEFSIPMETALDAYSLEAALISGFEDLAATLSVGRRADLVLLDSDPGQGNPDSTRVLFTIAGGRAVYRDACLPEGSADGF